MAMTAGHGEYWTREMRDGFEAAREAGVHLAFMGSNTSYWQVRYEDDERTMVGYKKANTDPHPDRELRTVRFRDLPTPRPECELLGVQYQDGLHDSRQDPPRDYSVVPSALDDPLLEGTGFTADTVLSDLVGYEWDAIQPGCEVPGLIPLLHWEGVGKNGPSSADAVHYTAPSRAHVFSSGSHQSCWGLDDYLGRNQPADSGLQQIRTSSPCSRSARAPAVRRRATGKLGLGPGPRPVEDHDPGRHLGKPEQARDRQAMPAYPHESSWPSRRIPTWISSQRSSLPSSSWVRYPSSRMSS